MQRERTESKSRLVHREAENTRLQVEIPDCRLRTPGDRSSESS